MRWATPGYWRDCPGSANATRTSGIAVSAWRMPSAYAHAPAFDQIWSSRVGAHFKLIPRGRASPDGAPPPGQGRDGEEVR